MSQAVNVGDWIVCEQQICQVSEVEDGVPVHAKNDKWQSGSGRYIKASDWFPLNLHTLKLVNLFAVETARLAEANVPVKGVNLQGIHERIGWYFSAACREDEGIESYYACRNFVDQVLVTLNRIARTVINEVPMFQ